MAAVFGAKCFIVFGATSLANTVSFGYLALKSAAA